ncbi:MAG: hypothetical protein LBH20_03175 [Treponema sp.]|jgi:hypothetical protein|nr:hypothetical protein [Treponema sp.]
MDNERTARITECYRRFIAAIVQQAVKDNAVEFLEIPEVKSYCVTAHWSASIPVPEFAGRRK